MPLFLTSSYAFNLHIFSLNSLLANVSKISAFSLIVYASIKMASACSARLDCKSRTIYIQRTSLSQLDLRRLTLSAS